MQLNPMFPETLLECITELNTTCVTMNAFRKSFEGHGRRRLNMFNTSFENSKRALFREQKEDKHPTDLILINFSSLQLFNFDRALASGRFRIGHRYLAVRAFQNLNFVHCL